MIITMVDHLAKNGQIREAEKIIASMPFPPNSSIWRSKTCKLTFVQQNLINLETGMH